MWVRIPPRAPALSRGGWAFRVDAGFHPETGKRRQVLRQGFATKKAAQSALNDLASASARGQVVTRSTISVQDYLAEWLATTRSKLRPSTHHSYAMSVDRIVAHLGRYQLQSLTPLQIERFYTEQLESGGRERGPLLRRRCATHTWCCARRSPTQSDSNSCRETRPRPLGHPHPNDTRHDHMVQRRPRHVPRRARRNRRQRRHGRHRRPGRGGHRGVQTAVQLLPIRHGNQREPRIDHRAGPTRCGHQGTHSRRTRRAEHRDVVHPDLPRPGARLRLGGRRRRCRRADLIRVPVGVRPTPGTDPGHEPPPRRRRDRQHRPLARRQRPRPRLDHRLRRTRLDHRHRRLPRHHLDLRQRRQHLLRRARHPHRRQEHRDQGPCGYTYRWPSAPKFTNTDDLADHDTAVGHWVITYATSTARSGTLGPIDRTTEFPYQVREIQTVRVSPDAPPAAKHSSSNRSITRRSHRNESRRVGHSEPAQEVAGARSSATHASSEGSVRLEPQSGYACAARP